LKLMKEDLLQIMEKLTFNQPLGFIPWRKMRSKFYCTFFPNNLSLISKHQVCTTTMAQKLFFEGFHFAHHSQCLHTYLNIHMKSTCWIQMLWWSSFTCFAPRWTHYLCLYLSDTFKSSFGFSFTTVNSLFCVHVHSYDKFKSCFGSFNSKFAWH
jgi:hypothetical protein